MVSIRTATVLAIGALVLIPVVSRAQTALDQAQTQQQPMPPQQQLPGITVTAPAPGPEVPPVSPVIERYSPPNTIVSTDRRKIEDTVNIVDTEDAVKYFPSLFVRKRNFGDTQAVLATRTWGVNSSARTLVYADDILLSALIGNNNTNGAPRWGLVSPEEIKGIDMMYGPFSAAYPGNSIGGVMLITTRMPEKFEATLKQTFALQDYSYYKTFNTYTTNNTAGTLGGKVGKLSFFLAANREENYSQPLAFVTTAGVPANTQGIIQQPNRTGSPANVVGASGLLHTIMDNYKLKWAVDINDWLKFSHTIGYWQNNADSSVQSYLWQNGMQTFGGQAGFASGTYKLTEQNLANAVSLKSDTRGVFDFEVTGTWYTYLTSTQRGPSGVLPTGMQFTTGGNSARMDGTGWWTVDAKGIWRPEGVSGPHEVTFGVHGDQYILNNPTYQMSNWITSPDQGNGILTSFSAGKTETWGLWAQEKWNFAQGWTATLGGRLDMWRAYGGYNINGSTAVSQAPVQAANFSPKASVAWQINPEWSTKLNYGQAVRYPTVNELYQLVTVGLTNVIPNPNLMPETAQSFEFSIERRDQRSALRLSLFEEDTANALIQQTSTINNTPTNNWQNVGLIRNRGVEFAGEIKDIGLKGLDLFGSVTYVDSKIISNPNFRSTFGSYSVGMWAPYVPEWRGTAVANYKPNDKWSFTAAARVQGKMYATLDNSDYISGVYQSFDPFFVVDLKARYQFMERAALEVGVDNVGDYKYFLFHPFPQRTFIASLKATF